MILRWTNTQDTHHRTPVFFHGAAQCALPETHHHHRRRRHNNNNAGLGIELASGSIDVLDSTKGDTFLNLRHQATLNFTRPGEEILLVTGRHSDFTGKARGMPHTHHCTRVVF
jgi:hypothetical protein